MVGQLAPDFVHEVQPSLEQQWCSSDERADEKVYLLCVNIRDLNPREILFHLELLPLILGAQKLQLPNPPMNVVLSSQGRVEDFTAASHWFI